MKRWFLKLHRWIALAFALPLTIVLATGRVLSVEPWLVVRTMAPGTLDVARVSAALRADGTAPAARNWPRLWHEGTFAGGGSAAMNVIASIAMIALLVTGPWLWLQRRRRRIAAVQGHRVFA